MRAPSRPRRKSAGQHPAQLQGISVSASAFAVLAVFVVYPILMTLRMGFYQSYVYLTDTGTGFGLNSFRYVLQDPAFGWPCATPCLLFWWAYLSRLCSPWGSPAQSFPASDQGTVSDTLFSPLCHLHPGHRPGVPLALPLGIRLHQLFSGVFGAGATEVAVRSQPDHCGGDHFTIWSGMAFKIVLFLAGCKRSTSSTTRRPESTALQRTGYSSASPCPCSPPRFGWSPSFRSFMPLRPTTRSMLCSAGRALGLETAPSLWSTIFMTCFSTGDRFTTPRRRPSSFWPSYWPDGDSEVGLQAVCILCIREGRI